MNENRGFNLDFSTQENSRIITEQERQEINRSLLNNQIKVNITEEVFSHFESQGFVVKQGETGYFNSNGSAMLNEPNFGDNKLLHKGVFENIARSKISSETNLLNNITYTDKNSGRSMEQIIKEEIKENGLWEEDDDFRVIVHRIDAESFAIAQRIPKYVDDHNQGQKQFEIFVTIVRRDDKTYVDGNTLRAIYEDDIRNLSDVFQYPKDYDEMQKAYKISNKENEEALKKYYSSK